MQVLAAHLYERPRSIAELRPDVPTALIEALERCLVKDPAERFSDVTSLEQALVRSVATES